MATDLGRERWRLFLFFRPRLKRAGLWTAEHEHAFAVLGEQL